MFLRRRRDLFCGYQRERPRPTEQPGVNILDRDSLFELMDRSEREGG